MSLQDFYGTYQVQTSSGTELGLDTTVVVADSQGTIRVAFTAPATGLTKTLDAVYDATTDSLRTEPQGQMRIMCISRFVDPTPGSLYRSIYGISIRNALGTSVLSAAMAYETWRMEL